ncbi:MAG: hypothetical protein WHX52_05095 [Anaerolineae bacterium]
MLRSTLKRNLFPIVLITLGCLIFLAIILYVFRAYLGIVIWVLFGLLLIGVGVLGIVLNNPKRKASVGDKPSRPSRVASGTPPPARGAPKYSAVGTRESKPGRQDTITVSRPLLIAAGVLFGCLVLLLLANVGTALRSLLTVRKTQIIDCQEAGRYAEDGWHFVSAYSYRVEDEVAGYTERTECVMERERFVWARDKRTPKKDDASQDEASQDDASDDDASDDDASTDDTFIDDIPPTDSGASYSEPPQTNFPPPPATQAPWPTAPLAPMSSPLPTWTLPALPTEPMATPLPALPTATPMPRTDIGVCDATSNDFYLDTYVQWEGMIIDDPTLGDEGLWFQVQWTNSNSSSPCSEATFFVSYDSTERFFAEDMVIVTGTITDIAYAYEGESGETEYAVVVKADNVEFVGE